MTYGGVSLFVAFFVRGAVVTLLAVCGCTHKESYFDFVMVGILGPLLVLAGVIVLGIALGSF